MIDEFITVGKLAVYNPEQYKTEGIIKDKKYKFKFHKNDNSSRDWKIYKNNKWTNIPCNCGIVVDIKTLRLHKNLFIYDKGKTISIFLSHDEKYFSLGVGTIYEVKKYGKIVNVYN